MALFHARAIKFGSHRIWSAGTTLRCCTSIQRLLKFEQAVGDNSKCSSSIRINQVFYKLFVFPCSVKRLVSSTHIYIENLNEIVF